MNTIITIGRQFGSGGREIGKKLADYYNIKCYDSELITKVTKESGFCQEIVEQQDERPTNSFLYNLVMDTYSFGYGTSSFTEMPISQKVFLAQYETIKKIAAEEKSCIFIGRCADAALSDFPNVINLFIHANEDFRVQRAKNYTDFTEEERSNNKRLLELILKKDKQRQSYYNYYTMKKWGRADTYNMTIDSSLLGIDGTVELIKQLVDDFEKKQHQ